MKDVEVRIPTNNSYSPSDPPCMVDNVLKYCFLLSNNFFLGIDIVGMEFFVYDDLEFELLAS